MELLMLQRRRTMCSNNQKGIFVILQYISRPINETVKNEYQSTHKTKNGYQDTNI